jgi:methylmalonyl-CoA epimerase
LAITKFDHIALVVDNLDESIEHFRKMFDIDDRRMIVGRDYKDLDPETGKSDVMHFALFPVGEVYLELIEPVSKEGPMMRFLRRTGGGVHHLGITSDDIRAEWKRHWEQQDELGVMGERPRKDHYDVSYWFLHPKKNYGIVWEVDAAWAKTSASEMTPIEAAPDWHVAD